MIFAVLASDDGHSAHHARSSSIDRHPHAAAASLPHFQRTDRGDQPGAAFATPRRRPWHAALDTPVRSPSLSQWYDDECLSTPPRPLPCKFVRVLPLVTVQPRESATIDSDAECNVIPRPLHETHDLDRQAGNRLLENQRHRNRRKQANGWSYQTVGNWQICWYFARFEL